MSGMSPNELVDIVQIFGISVASISTLIGLLILFHKKVMVPLVFMFDGYRKLCEKVDTIFKELQSNDGKSLKDTVGKVYTYVKILDSRHKAVLANTIEGHFETDSDGNCIWANRTLIKILECVPSELMGNGWINFIAPEERKNISNLWHNSIADNVEATLRLNLVTNNNEIIPVLLKSYKLVGSKGEKLGFFATIHFVSEVLT